MLTYTEFRAQALEELSWIPRDSSRIGQRMFRSAYWNDRLSPESRAAGDTAADVFRRSMAKIRRFHRTFVPAVSGPFSELVD